MEGGGLQKITNLPLNFANPPYALINESPLTRTIAIAQPLLNFFNKDPTKNVYLVIIYKKTGCFSESKTTDVHCFGAKMSFHIFSNMLF